MGGNLFLIDAFLVRFEYRRLREFYNSRGEDLLRSGRLPVLAGEEKKLLFDDMIVYWPCIKERATDRIVAAAMLCREVTARGSTGIVEYVLVDRDFRHKGLGRAIMNDLHRKGLHDWNCRKFFLHSENEEAREDARGMYEKMGYILEEGTDCYYSATRKAILANL
ncbi:MAG: GNAT family N-acetyltransferase [bacterium]